MPPYTEDELLPVSALQHLVFCPRQCALIHLEGQWTDNQLTAEGRRLHERADEPAVERRGGLRIVRGLPLRSLQLGLAGRADVVEFHKQDRKELPFPVEYKRGKPKIDDCDRVQLCAQALCLEEMLGCDIPSGAIFYGKPRRREDVLLDEELRRKTAEAAQRLHELVRTGASPPPSKGPWCDSCSMKSVCLPGKLKRKVDAYFDRMLP